MASYYKLGSGLGAAFNAAANGDAVQNAAYGQQLRQNLQDELLQGKAADQQASDAAYAKLPSDLETIGVPSGQGAAYTDLARATGSKANELMSAFKTAVQAGYLRGAQDAFNKGDTLRSNFELAAGGGKPLEYTKIDGNTAYSPNQAPLSQAFRTTPYGQQELQVKGRTGSPKTFVGNDGVLRIIHPDGSSEAVKDGTGRPVMADDVKTAASVYHSAYGANSLDAPKFMDWYNSTWPKLRASQSGSGASAAPGVSTTQGASAPAAGAADTQALVSKALKDAQVAIQAGAPRVQVRARLLKMGARPEQLKAIGLQ